MDKKKVFKFLPVLSFLVLVCACDIGTFELGQDYVESNTYVELIDTVTIELSTFRFDSIQTSGSGVAWVGSAVIPEVGTMRSESFFKVQMPSGITWNNKEVYDSICISLKHSGDYLGDTLQPFTLTVNPVTQTISGNDGGTIYNNRATLFDPSPVGTYCYTPRPNEKPRISFRLNDEFGLAIHNFCRENYQNSESSTLFESFLKGIRLGTDGDSRAMMAFAAQDSTLSITLYSHLPSIEDETLTREISLSDNTLQYNYMQTSELEHQFGTLTDYKQMLPSKLSDNMALMHEGNGYYIRADIPYINELLDANQKGYIVKADLLLYPVKGTYLLADLPSSLYLHEIQKVNAWGSIIYSGDQTQVTGTLYSDPLFNEDIYYQIDITQYLNSRLTESIVNTDNGITFTWSSSRNGNYVDALLFGVSGNKTSRSRLKIYYYYYDKD